jgi:hypothetical protein
MYPAAERHLSLSCADERQCSKANTHTAQSVGQRKRPAVSLAWRGPRNSDTRCTAGDTGAADARNTGSNEIS